MKIIKKVLIGIFSIAILISVVYALGPRVNFEDVDNRPLEGGYTLDEVETVIAERNQNKLIKKGNEEVIIWADGKQKTEYAFVYIHGFSASHEEGGPTHRNIANRYGANLLLTRLPRHGLSDENSFQDLTPSLLVEYAKEAVKIGKSIGNKVVLLSCSTGGTLSTYLAAADPEIEALVMFSPNLEMNDQNTKLLTKPWGLSMARKIKKSDYHEWNTPQVARPFWYHKYRLEGVAAVQGLIDEAMTDDLFRKLELPIYVGYFYKDESTKDFTISTDRIMDFEKLISTPADERSFVQYPDGKAHVFISPFFNENWDRAQGDVYDFLEEVLAMEPVSLAVQ